MIRRAVAALVLIAVFASSAAAQESVTVATTRDVPNGALFLAAARGYFKAEGLTLSMRAYPSPPAAVQALAGGEADLALAAFSAAAFNLAARGAIKAVAAQVREKHDYEGNEIVVSVTAYARGLHKLGNLPGKAVAVNELGSVFHYQLGRLAEHEHFSLGSLTLKPLTTVDAMVQAVMANKVDAAILPAFYAREMLLAGQARLIGWVSEVDEQQMGALFASAATLQRRRAMAAKFLRAYRRGVADYAAALLRRDAYHKRIQDAKSREAAEAIGHYVFPGRDAENAGRAVAGAAYFMDAQARLDMADFARQVAWYKAQGFIGSAVKASDLVDLNFR
jgi:NitT/TauT family transport system substrate-binding protein